MTNAIGSFPEHLQPFVRENEPLGPLTWLKIGGPARYFFEPTDEEGLVAFVKVCHERSIPMRLLGGGSNLLVRESGFDGAVISIAAATFSSISVEGTRVRCGGGAKLSNLVTHSVAAGLSGLEHLIGIPGTVGGALHGNSSTHDGDIGQRVRSARLLHADGTIETCEGAKLHFSTGKSSLDELVILDCNFELEKVDRKALTGRMQTRWIVKRSEQPSSQYAAAMAFVDPLTTSAAELIEKVGMRGAVEGAVQLSSTFSNFLIAGPGATTEQVLALTSRVQNAVFRQTGVQLQLHLKIW
jgi:UDP-N-acetylmuramate dehydrogenase